MYNNNNNNNSNNKNNNNNNNTHTYTCASKTHELLSTLEANLIDPVWH